MGYTASNIANGKRKIYIVLGICIFLYFATLVQKNMFSCELVEILRYFNISKAKAGMASTCYFFTYAIGQLAVAKFFPKLHLLKFLTVTLFLSALLTVLIPLCTSIYQIWVIFAVNGFLQAGSWPGIFAVIVKYVPQKLRVASNNWLSVGYTAGFCVDYTLASVLLKWTNWKVGFYIAAVVLLGALAVFYFVVSGLRNSEKPFVSNKAEKVAAANSGGQVTKSKKINVFYVVIFFGCMLVGVLYYGILNWVPNILCDVFGVSSSKALLAGTVLSVAMIVGPVASTFLCEKTSCWKIGKYYYFAAFLFSVLLALFYSENLYLTVAMTLVPLLVSRSITNIDSAFIPMKCHKLINAGSFAATTDTFLSIGAAIGPTLFGAVIDGCGYTVIYVMMAVLFLSGGLSIVANQKILKEIVA